MPNFAPAPHPLPSGATGVSVAHGRCARRLAGQQALAEAWRRLGGQADAWPLCTHDPRGARHWPDGFVGSVTHGDGCSHAALVRRGEVQALGMDSTAVLAASPARELLAWIADGAEVRCLRAVADWPLPEATAALFAVKEAFYKAVCTPDPRAMEFDAVRLVAVDRSAPDLWHLRLQANGPWLHVGADGPMCTAHVRTTRRADAPVEQHAAVWWG